MKVITTVPGLLLLLLPLLLCSSCLSIPEFDEPSIVDRPRVLAIVAEPPEVAPGQTVELSAMLAAPTGEDIRDYPVRWSVCAAFFTEIRGSQYGDEPQDQGCGPDAPSFGDGPVATLPGEVTAALFANLDLAAEAFGSLLPEDTVEAIRQEVGLPLLVEATVETEGRVVRAAKRVLVNGSGRSHRNPPPPSFELGGVAIGAVAGERFECRATDGEPVRWPTGSEVELAPILIAGEEDPELEYWVERYPILNARGEVVERAEKPFYSWFSTGGKFEQGVTEAPLRNEIWKTPELAGPTPLWLVVRDGHGGTSACMLEVELFEQ